jgi:hypothetical protein
MNDVVRNCYNKLDKTTRGHTRQFHGGCFYTMYKKKYNVTIDAAFFELWRIRDDTVAWVMLLPENFFQIIPLIIY